MPAIQTAAAAVVRRGFDTYLSSHNRAPNTIHIYHFTVEQYLNRYSRLTYRNLQLYKVYLIEHYKPQTVNLRIRALNSYLEYCKSDICPLSMVKVQQKTYLDKIITHADYEYLKRRLWEDEEYSYFYLVWLTAATGVRVSELVTFRIEDIKLGHKDVYSKGNKMRRVYVPTRLKCAILDWLEQEHRATGPLFLNRYGSALSVTGVRSRLKDFAARYCLDPEVMYPHSFRHRFAKNFIENSGDITLLSDLLGHESLETTRIYLRRSSTEQARIVNQVVNW